MAPQRLEKIESGPGNGMGSEAADLQDVVRGRAADRARLRLTSRNNDKVAKMQKKAPNALKSLDAELKSAPACGHPSATPNTGGSAKGRASPASPADAVRRGRMARGRGSGLLVRERIDAEIFLAATP